MEKEMATHSSRLAWRIPRTEEPDRLWSTGSQSRTRLERLSTSYKNHKSMRCKCRRLTLKLKSKSPVLSSEIQGHHMHSPRKILWQPPRGLSDQVLPHLSIKWTGNMAGTKDVSKIRHLFTDLNVFCVKAFGNFHTLQEGGVSTEWKKIIIWT